MSKNNSRKQLLLGAVMAGVAALAGITPAAATVLTFDDLNTGGAGTVASSYGDFTLNGWWHIDNPPYSYPYVSAPTVIYNSESAYTNTPEILSNLPIDLLSVYLADYDTGGSVTLLGYSGSSLLYSSTVALGPSMSQYNLNFMGIDKFVMETPAASYAFLDNFEYQASSVPEPASLALVGLGLAGMSFLRRRQKAS